MAWVLPLILTKICTTGPGTVAVMVSWSPISCAHKVSAGARICAPCRTSHLLTARSTPICQKGVPYCAPRVHLDGLSTEPTANVDTDSLGIWLCVNVACLADSLSMRVGGWYLRNCRVCVQQVTFAPTSQGDCDAILIADAVGTELIARLDALCLAVSLPCLSRSVRADA